MENIEKQFKGTNARKIANKVANDTNAKKMDARTNIGRKGKIASTAAKEKIIIKYKIYACFSKICRFADAAELVLFICI
jgi:hypothetical protein